MTSLLRSIILVVALALIGGAIFYLESQKTARPTDAEVVTVMPRDTSTTTPDATPIKSEVGPMPAPILPALSAPSVIAANSFLSQAEKAKKYKLAKEITTPDGFINTGGDGKPVTIGEYIGKKVVLVDFWTYSCINCQRTQPFLNAWWSKYEKDGLVIIGIHTPEFEFEKDFQNVKNAVTEEKIGYPVVLDNDFSTWYAYENRFWPRKYLIDIDGYIVYDHIGEGAYAETEKKIQELLAERMAVLNIKNVSDVIGSGTVSPIDATTQTFAVTSEIYFGAARNEALGNGQKNETGLQTLTAPEKSVNLFPNLFYLSGKWNFTNQYAESRSDEAHISLKYKAKNVFFVASADDATQIKITRDGVPLSASFAGDDVRIENEESIVTVKNSKLYKLIEDSSAGEHVLEITIPEGNLKAFTFTFG
ncbi:MAG: redoxin family protein [Patescibacteria group bacterium]